MPHNPEAFAEMVVMTVKSALGPILERVAAMEAKLDAKLEMATANHLELSHLRDRLVASETKAQMVVSAPATEPAPPLDLSPILERVAASEAKLQVVGDLRDRVVAMETKSAAQPAPDHTVLDLRDRVTAMETKAMSPQVSKVPEDIYDKLAELSTRPIDLSVIQDRVSKLEIRLDVQPNEVAPLKSAFAESTKDVGSLRERVAALEARGPVPGPPGKDGRDGLDGKDGKDGLGFEDMDLEYDGARTFAFKFERGPIKKSWPVKLGVPSYVGVYQDGQTYQRGDLVTWSGSMWHCNTETTVKPGESKAWTLCVQRGREGKPGKDFHPETPPPVVRIAERS